MQFRQERSDRLADQIAIVRRHELVSCLVGQFDEASLVDRNNGCRAGFNQDTYPFLGLKTEALVAENLGGQQPTATQRQRFKSQTNVGVGWIQITKTLAQQCAC
ncbi:MAG: hypothetical protein WAN65_11640 [Candidatus Sulfotelmatobacter sp.]